MSTPSRLTAPARAALGTSSCIRLRIRKKVDLPQPEGPMRAVTFLGSMTKFTRSHALLLPNHALMFVACKSAGPPTGAENSGWPWGAAGGANWSTVVTVGPPGGPRFLRDRASSASQPLAQGPQSDLSKN